MEEALVATGPVSAQESTDLDAALVAFHDAPPKQDRGTITTITPDRCLPS
jgi:hypothetical protein